MNFFSNGRKQTDSDMERTVLYDSLDASAEWRATPSGGVLIKEGRLIFTPCVDCPATVDAWESAKEPQSGNYVLVNGGKIWQFGAKLVFQPE